MRLHAGMRHQVVPDRQIAEIAARQAGVIRHAQLRACGLSASGIQRRVRAGRLHRLFRGVYGVGHRAVGPVGRHWAAVLACGDGAVLSHGAARAAWGMRPTSSGGFDINVARGGRARRAGLRVHTATLLPDEVTRLDGLPITTPARTLLDLATSGIRNLETVLDRAEQQRLVDFDELHSLLERYPRRPGTRSLKAQLARYRGPVDVRSELERLVYQLCDAHGLPRPHVNCVIEGEVRDSIGRGAGSSWRRTRTRGTGRLGVERGSRARRGAHAGGLPGSCASRGSRSRNGPSTSSPLSGPRCTT